MANESSYRRQVTLGELIGFAIVILGGIITGYVTLKKDDERHEIRIRHLEEQRIEDLKESKDFENKMTIKLDEILHTQTLILVKLEQKEDRK